MKLRYAAFTAALAVSGCAKEPLQIGSVYVKSLLIRASEGGRMVVDSTDHGALAGAGVVVEANALSQDTTVTVEVGDANLGDTDGEDVGPSVKFGPADVTFSTPARVSIPYDGTYDEDLARVWVAAADGGRRVLLPTDLSYDATLGTVTFSTTSFASYRSGRARRACSHVQCDRDECRRGACVPLPTCDESACGARPGVPSWTCSDGSDGGSTGRCIRQVDGTCGWEIIWCPKECQTTECGPAPTRGVVFCDDGSVQGPVCTRNTRGICAWQTPSCNLGCDPVSCGTPPAEPPGAAAGHQQDWGRRGQGARARPPGEPPEAVAAHQRDWRRRGHGARGTPPGEPGATGAQRQQDWPSAVASRARRAQGMR